MIFALIQDNKNKTPFTYSDKKKTIVFEKKKPFGNNYNSRTQNIRDDLIFSKWEGPKW
jgi:hypothetical protein